MFDAYVRRARFYPAVIAAAPGVAFAAIFVPWTSLGLPHLFVAGAMAILLAVASDVARRRGVAIEPGIIRRMGGLPSTTTMRYRDDTDDTFDRAAKAAMHKFLGVNIGAGAPTPESEKVDPAAADDFYRRSGNWLRENTRDKRKFNILFDENVTYGFRRNLLGLKWPAVALDAAVVVGCLVMLWFRFPFNAADAPTQKFLSVLIIALLHSAYFLVFVTEAGVMEAARTYARQLLLCTETLATGAPVKAAQKPKKRKSTPRNASS
jgi:hypothetical protein